MLLLFFSFSSFILRQKFLNQTGMKTFTSGSFTILIPKILFSKNYVVSFFSLCLSLSLSLCLSLFWPVLWSVSLSVLLFVSLSVCLAVYIFICLSLSLSVFRLSGSLFCHSSLVCLSLSLSLFLSI